MNDSDCSAAAGGAKLMSLEQAQEVLLSHAPVIDGTQRVALADALGRVLAEPVTSAIDMPPSQSVSIETYEPRGPMGAKESGEGLVSPTAPAIDEAVFHATGFRCMELPITPEKILKGMNKSRERAKPKS